MKRQETLDIENKLNEILTDRHRNSSFGYYGCEEVTIGFANNGHGNEIVDFMSMDSKGTIRCYEIKVTMADLKSKAKLSFYGHYNYLVIGGELLDKLDDVKLLTPKEIGILDNNLSAIRRPKLKGIHTTTETMLKESLVRSMYHKMNKYKKSQDIEEYKKLESKAKRVEREKNKYQKDYQNFKNDIWNYENYLRRHKNIEFCLEDEIYNMKQEENRNK